MKRLEGAKKIGVFGGSFNPPHNGHIYIARRMKEAFSLDEVLFVVAGDPPHKSIAGGVGADARYSLVEAALEGEEGLIPSDIELKREGKSYTVETMRALRSICPEAELSLIVGADMLYSLDGWREPAALFSICSVLAAARPGYPENLHSAAEALRQRFGARVSIAEFAGPDISSTAVRNAVRDAEDVSALVPCGVEKLIYGLGLYQPGDILDMQAKLKASIKPRRFEHSIGTMKTAIALARRFGENAEKARVAGLLHDCAKLPEDALLSLAEGFDIPVGELEKKRPGLLHDRIGARIAERDYGITDGEILSAIASHTLCPSGMSDFALMIYLADKIEPTRDYPGIERLRAAAEGGIARGALACMENVVAHLLANGEEIHPDIYKAIEELKARTQK